MIRTLLCELLGIELPIIQAPIGSATCPELAAAVSNSGGLGMLSVTWRTPSEIRTLLQETRSLTKNPFGINLVLDADVHDKLNICLDEGVKIVSFFWGAPNSYIDICHEAGAVVLHSVGSVSEAQQAAAAGADVIIAQGWEAGGHVRGTIGSLVLVPRVVDAVAPTPVVAAGGIADGRGIAAALVLGAAGVWLGTRFVASEESLAHQLYKRRLLMAEAEDTVYSELFDIGWEHAPHRTLRNTTIDIWQNAGSPPSGKRPGEGEVIANRADGSPVERYSSSMPLETMKGEVEGLALYAGQSVGLVKEIKSVATIMHDLKRETEQALRIGIGNMG